MNNEASMASAIEARERFNRARRRADTQRIVGRLSGRGSDLLPFEVLAHILQGYQKIPRREAEMIPIDKIVGSVGRYKDFTRDFQPRSDAMSPRWVRVDQAMSSMEGVPPIDVYKLGDVYFVSDGNHRASVARANGFDHISAVVTEIDIPVDIDLRPGDSLDQAIIKAERAHFLAETGLHEHFECVDVFFTKPGGYPKLLEHIAAHRCTLEDLRADDREITLTGAALDWYNTIYRPIIDNIRDRHLLDRFPNHTAADLYVWVWNTLMELHRATGERFNPAEGTALLELRAESEFGQSVGDLMGRLTDLSRGFTGGLESIPDWVSYSFEWGDPQANQSDKGQG